MAKTHFPRSGGSQWIDSFYRFGTPVGNFCYVNSGSGTDSAGYGYSPESPLATIAYAVATAAVADNHDYVMVMPGHVETIVGAAGVAMSKAGVTLRGLGASPWLHTINYTTAIAASFDVTAARCTIENLSFTVDGFDAITAAMNVTGADFTMRACEWRISSANKGPVLGILTAATATRFKVEDCLFRGAAANSGTTCTAIIKHEVGIDYVIRRNYFTAKCTQAILNATTILGGLIDSNRFTIATGAAAITMASASTPLICGNLINTNGGASTTVVVAAAGFVVGNAYSAAPGVTAGTALTW